MFQHPNHRGPKGEEEEQEIENLFEKIIKENFPNLVKEIDIQEAQRAQTKMDTKRSLPRHIIIKMPKVKDKEIIHTGQSGYHKQINKQVLVRMWRKGSPDALLRGMWTGLATVENIWSYLKKLKMKLPSDPASTLGIYPKKPETLI